MRSACKKGVCLQRKKLNELIVINIFIVECHYLFAVEHYYLYMYRHTAGSP